MIWEAAPQSVFCGVLFRVLIAVIPAAALFEDAETGRFHVFVAGADGRAHRTDVTIGLRDAKQVQITRGLKPGDLVITSGGYALSDGLKVSVAQTQQ
jgi:multidrug efflux pump subunit AcrA (membrane-fusion protein)